MRIVAHSVDDLDMLAQDFEDSVNQQIRHVLTTSLDHISSDVDSLGYIATRWSNDAVKKELLPKLEAILRSGASTVHKKVSDKVLTAAAPKRTLSVPFIPDPIMEHYLSEAENRLVNVGDIVWGKARDAMLEGVQAGEGINDIRDRIVASSDLAAPRAGVIARTEVNSAANFGTIQGMRALDVSAKKEWIATTDERTRQSHVDADAQQVELHEPFMVGDVPLDRPGDPNGPPEETINCRCTISFELPDEMVQDIPVLDEDLIPIAASAKGVKMPWHTVQDSGECPTGKPWAVVQDDTGEIVGCHANEDDANSQLAALNASEKNKKPATGGTEDFDAIAPAPVSDIAPAVDGNPSGWEGVIVVEGVPTGDGREFAPDALTWSDLPLPLRWNKEDSHGGMPHTVAVNVGRIDEIWKDGNEIKARGVFNLNEGDGKRAYDMVKDQFLRGVSVDVDDVADADMEMIWSQEDDEDADIFDLLFAAPEKIIFHHGRIRAATLCDIPAFPEAYVKITEPTPASLAASAAHVTVTEIPLVAHAAEPAWNPPVEWFNNPQLPLLCPITVTAGGRVYGHAAEFGDCHIGYGDRCVKVPMEDSHDYFMTGTVVCADGSEVAVGQITADIPHAPTYGIGSDVRSATAHYDQTDAVVADVVVGNDQHGIWVAGAVRPWAKAKGVHALRASGQVSPDWRSIGGSLRMVGLLTVNISGFQVPKPAARVASGKVVSLVAAGIPALGRGLPEATAKEIETKTLVQQLAARIGLDDKSKEDARRQRVSALAEYIHKGGDKANV